jgi:hypothetical protein
MGFAAKERHTPWKDYVRRLEATGRVRFVAAGEQLKTRGVYIDLNQPCRGPIRALEGQTAGSRNRYLAREDVPADVWCAIIEHCACVDRVTGAFTPLEDLPCLKRQPESPAFAA